MIKGLYDGPEYKGLPIHEGLWVDGDLAIWVAEATDEGVYVERLGALGGPVLDDPMLLQEADIDGYKPFHPVGIGLADTTRTVVPRHTGLYLDRLNDVWIYDGETLTNLRDHGTWRVDGASTRPDDTRRAPWTMVGIQWPSEETPWKPGNDDPATNIIEPRVVHLPPIQSFGRLTPDKWLALKTLEESAELVEAVKQWIKAEDPADPTGIGDEFDKAYRMIDEHGFGAAVDHDEKRYLHMRRKWVEEAAAERRGAALAELADVLQTCANLVTAFDIGYKELEHAMRDCRERNRLKGRL